MGDRCRIGYSVVLGLLMGIPTLRLRADYLAIVTIAAAEIIRLIVRSVRFKDVFGGTDGINDFSGAFRQARQPTIGASSTAEHYGVLVRSTFTGRELWTLIVGWALVAIFGTLVWLLMRSPWGRVLKAIREDEDAVRSLGKNVYSYKMQALILGGVIGMLAGMILALDRGSVQPDNYSRDVTFYILTALVLGGVAKVTGSIVGPMLFWAVFAFTDSFLRELDQRTGRCRSAASRSSSRPRSARSGSCSSALLLMLLMVFRPQGLFGNRKEMAFDGR